MSGDHADERRDAAAVSSIRATLAMHADDVGVPMGAIDAAVARGRTQRRKRYAGVALLAAAVIAAGPVVWTFQSRPDGVTSPTTTVTPSPSATSSASPSVSATPDDMETALPAGPAPRLAYAVNDVLVMGKEHVRLPGFISQIVPVGDQYVVSYQTSLSGPSAPGDSLVIVDPAGLMQTLDDSGRVIGVAQTQSDVVAWSTIDSVRGGGTDSERDSFTLHAWSPATGVHDFPLPATEFAWLAPLPAYATGSSVVIEWAADPQGAPSVWAFDGTDSIEPLLPGVEIAQHGLVGLTRDGEYAFVFDSGRGCYLGYRVVDGAEGWRHCFDEEPVGSTDEVPAYVRMDGRWLDDTHYQLALVSEPSGVTHDLDVPAGLDAGVGIVWEDDQHVIVTGTSRDSDGDRARMYRCDVQTGACEVPAGADDVAAAAGAWDFRMQSVWR